MKKAWHWLRAEHDVPIHGWVLILFSYWCIYGSVHDLIRLGRWLGTF